MLEQALDKEATLRRPSGRDPEVTRRLVPLMMALLVVTLDVTIVAPAMPTTISALGGGPSAYAWTLTAMTLTATATTPIWGRFCDLYDKLRLLTIAMGVFVACGVLCGLAQNPGEMISARALQGIGVGGVQVVVQSIIAVLVPPRDRVRYNSVYSAVIAVGTTTGPLIGGLLVGLPGLGWRSCFWVTAPLAAFALVFIRRRISVVTLRREVVIDYTGAALICGGAVLVLLAVSEAGASRSLLSWPVVIAAVLGLAAWAVALRVELRARQPILPIALLRRRAPALTAGAAVGIGACSYSGTVLITEYLQIGRGLSALESGALQVPSAIGILSASLVSSRILVRTGRLRPVLLLGSLFVCAGYGGLGLIGRGTSLWMVGVCLFVSGAGLGMTFQNLVTSIQNSVGTADVGAAGGAISFLRALAGTVALQGLTAIASVRIAGRLHGGIDVSSDSFDLAALTPSLQRAVRDAYTDTMWLEFLICAALAGTAVVAVIAMRDIVLRDTIELVPGPDVSAEVAELGTDTGVPLSPPISGGEVQPG